MSGAGIVTRSGGQVSGAGGGAPPHPCTWPPPGGCPEQGLLPGVAGRCPEQAWGPAGAPPPPCTPVPSRRGGNRPVFLW
jgi:hypothetical protein